MTRTFLLTAPLALMLTACGPEETSSYEPEDIDLLDARSQLIRLSVDLRGKHPTEREIQSVEENPALYNWYAEQWIDEPAFLVRLREIYNVRWLTRTGDTYFDLDERGLGGYPETLVGDVIADEPLQLLTYIVENDLPFHHMVTADHTMANPILAEMWDIDYPDGATGWQPAHYRDGRPHAGILTMTTIWQRYPSMGGNANRHRANAVSKMLLCDDYLARPIVLNRSAVDLLTIDPENAISVTPSCQSCHSTLDPLAANFFGFFTYEEDGNTIDPTVYRPEFENLWREYAGKPPSYYGVPTANLEEMGHQMARDSRLIDCAVQTVFEGLTQRTITEDDWHEVQRHTNTFVLSDQNVKELVRSIVISDEYKTAAVNDSELADRIASVKTASPSQLAGIIEDVTGFRWSFDGRDGMTRNDLGLPVLAGGIDSRFVTTPSYVPSVGGTFVQERLAQAAAWDVAARDLDPNREGDAKLLLFVTINDTPENNPEAFEEQIRYLYLAATGHALADDATEPQHLMNVWKYQYSVEASPTAAWAGVISAVLRDPQVLFY